MFKIPVFTTFLLFVTVFAVSAIAAEIPVQECGKPDPAQLNTDPGGVYCNIYSRQLNYAEEDAKFRKLLQERQKNFGAPSLKAVRQYRKDIKTLHGFDDTEQSDPGSDAKSGETEAFGPAINP
jgi:hypothetical protein